MSGRDLAEALLSASNIDIDDAGDILARSYKGRDIVEQLNRRKHVYQYGPTQLSSWHAAADVPIRKPKTKKATK